MPEFTHPLDVEQILATGQLPALPQSAITLLQLSKDPNVGPAEFSLPIEADPGLTSQVLRFVNSSYFGFSREVSSVKLAITLVGMRTIKNFTLWSAVFSLMPNPKCGPFDLKSLWQDSLRRALFARKMSKTLGAREIEEPFAAALLQDMAVPLLAKQYPQEYLKLLTDRNDGANRLSNLEAECFGCTHPEVAGQMARNWKLPDNVANLIESHIKIDELSCDAVSRPGEAAVALSALLPANHDEKWFECSQFEEFFNRMAPQGGGSIVETLEAVDKEFMDFAPVLKISCPKKSLVEAYNECRAAAV